MLTGKSFIAGQPGSRSEKTFRAINPASGNSFTPDFHEATASEADAALTAAAEAFAIYRNTTGAQRADFLEAIATEIETIGDELIERAHAETGLPVARLQGERARTCGQLRLFAQIVREGSWVDARIDPALPARQPLPRADLRRMLQPLGPVVVFGSSNFPFAFSTAGGDTASALAAGCPVVVKAHRGHPGTGELVAAAVNRAIVACDLPAGIFSLIHGEGATVGMALVKHPATVAVGFTGSHAAGRALADAAAARSKPIPVFAEMSSLNPVFILPAALRERSKAIAQGLVTSFTLGVGQFCTKPGLVFLPPGPASAEFQHALAAAVQMANGGTMLTPGIRGAFLANRAQIMGVSGVGLLGQADKEADVARNEAQPSIALTTATQFMAAPKLATEAFGPFTLVVQAEQDAELADCAATLDGQLTATLHGTPEDFSANRALIALLEQKAGRIVFNGFPTGVEVCHAMNHGGPYPATTDARFTSVGATALLRFVRPVCYQGMPDNLLPAPLQNRNPLGLLRLFDGVPTRDPITEVTGL